MCPHGALVARKGQQRIQSHLARCNRTGFVQTQHIRTGERLNAVQLLHKGVSLAELDYANRQGDRNQQNQPFGNHADHGGDGISAALTMRIRRLTSVISTDFGRRISFAECVRRAA